MGAELAGTARILELLRLERSVSWIATELRLSLQDVRAVRDANKLDILTSRKKAGQSPEGIAYQLDLIGRLDQIRKWYTQETET